MMRCFTIVILILQRNSEPSCYLIAHWNLGVQIWSWLLIPAIPLFITNINLTIICCQICCWTLWIVHCVSRLFSSCFITSFMLPNMWTPSHYSFASKPRIVKIKWKLLRVSLQALCHISQISCSSIFPCLCTDTLYQKLYSAFLSLENTVLSFNIQLVYCSHKRYHFFECLPDSGHCVTNLTCLV